MEGLKGGRRFQYKSWKCLVYMAVGLILFSWLVYTPVGLLGKADAIGYAVCHRIEVRSFHLGDRQVPLCARCTGMYLGAMLGLTYLVLIGRRRTGTPPMRVILVLGLLVLAFCVDGLNSYLSLFPGLPSLYEPHNILRLVTGTGVGIAIVAALFPAFNQTVWKDFNTRPALKGLRSLGLLLILAILLDLAVLMENSLILYPLALISAVGVVVLLTMVYTMVLLMALKRENRFNHLTELNLHLAAGFAMSLIQLGLLDLGRYLLTGTWDGFHLG